MANKNLETFRRKCLGYSDTYLQFDNMSDLISVVESNIGNFPTMRIGSESTFDGGFYYSNSINEAINLAKYGWQEGIEKLNSKLKIQTQNQQYKNIYDIAGGHVSVPRYLNGYPTSMIRKVTTQRKDTVITVVKVCSVLGSASVNQMINEGSKFVQIIQNIEANGYRCNVDVIFASSYRYQDLRNGAHVVRVRIKKTNERLNPAKMCFPMVHPSMFRRFIFKLREIDPVLKQQGWTSSGSSFYGSGDYREEKRGNEMISKYLNKGDYFIPYTIPDPATFKLEEFEFKKHKEVC